MQELWKIISESWQVKAISSGAVSCLTFLIGDITAAPFVALWVLVVIDTATRWAAIGRKTLADNNMTGSLLDGIWLAIIEKQISSEVMRCRFQTKAVAYLVLLIGFNLLDIIIPDRIFGQDVVGMPNTFISTWLAFVELQSIIENLIECGMSGLTPLSQWVSNKRAKMTETPPGGNVGGSAK